MKAKFKHIRNSTIWAFAMLMSITLITHHANAQELSVTRETVAAGRPLVIMQNANGLPVVLIRVGSEWKSFINDGTDWIMSPQPFPFPGSRLWRSSYHWNDVRGNTLFFYAQSAIYRSIDNGLTWESIFGAPEGTLLHSMWSADSGYRMLQTSDGGERRLNLRTSIDSGRFFLEPVSDVLLDTLAPGRGISDPRVLSRDSVALLLNSNKNTTIATTSNRGLNWSVHQLMDTNANSSRIYYGYLALTKNHSRFHAIGGAQDSIEYSTTSDFGKTWTHFAGSAADRIYRFVEGSDGTLWKLVGRKEDLGAVDLWNLLTGFDDRDHFADSLFVSHDNGAKWSLVPSLLGDTVLEMTAGPNGQLFVISYRDKNAIATTISVSASVEAVSPPRLGDLKLFPNPAATSVRFSVPRKMDTRLSLIDVLGRTHFQSSRKLEANALETIEFPTSLTDYKGPLYLRIEHNGKADGQMFMKY